MRMLFIALMLLGLTSSAAAGEDARGPELWFFVSTNLSVEENVAEVEGLIARAARVGYSRLVLTDTWFSRLDVAPARYAGHVERVKRAAAAHRVVVVPAFLKMGWSNSLLAGNPSLVEAMQVHEALFIVRGGEARLEADPLVGLRGGDMRDLSLWDWRDHMVTADDGAAKVTDPRGRNARLVQTIRVKPRRQYRISVRVRSREFQGTPMVIVLAGREGGRTLAHAQLGVERSQDWRMHHAVFNSMEHEEVTVYLGVWNGQRGELWWDEASIEEVGLLNVVRRESSPLSVRLEECAGGPGDGRGEVLREHVDYERIVDDRLGEGRYSVAHEPPVIELLRPLPEGTRLRVSYEHAMTVYDGQAMICPSDPATVELMREQAQRVHALWGASEYFLYYDEVRILNQDHACQQRKMTPGEILADNVRTAVEIMREVNPVRDELHQGGRAAGRPGRGGLYIWSDMFDPHHNARRDYFLVNGDLAGSWEGLDAGVTIVVWNFDKREESLAFFADRGHAIVIAGYYDHPLARVDEWLEAAAGHERVVGVMYMTWQGSYDALEAFAGRVQRWKAP